MLEEQLISGIKRSIVDGSSIVDVFGLTPKGHDYLDALVRKPKVDDEKKKWWNNNPLFDFFIAVIKKLFEVDKHPTGVFYCSTKNIEQYAQCLLSN